MADLPEKILQHLSSVDGAESLQLANHFGEEHQKIVGAIKSLQSLGDVVDVEQKSNLLWELTAEGKQVAEKGSHEAVLFGAIPPEGKLQAELMKTVPNAKVGFNKAMSAGWISIDKSKGAPVVFRKVDSIADKVQQHLQLVLKGTGDKLPEADRQEYKKRKLMLEITVKTFSVHRGKEFSTSVNRLETDLTGDMIASGSWKTLEFKPYNFDALGTTLTRGHLHPLLKVRAEFRQIFLEMGFTEMPTNNYIESCFWNFDALFQPQQHPARDAHDTFFITEPRMAKVGPEDYVEKVAHVHSKGGFGSQGYGYSWDIEEARKNVLRTHTTAVSARMLYKLAQQPEFQPAKYFSIDRVFRNETLDATHLAEFCQIEGVVADHGLTLGHLVGTLYEFFSKLGITQLKFKPAYNPYTEPSMEIFSFHPGLKKWVEIGNSGLFRPEMLLPMGLPEDVSVIAWGLSLERPTMIKYGIDNIRDLVGPRVNLQMVHDNSICRLEKHGDNTAALLSSLQENWDSVFERAKALAEQVSALRHQLLSAEGCARADLPSDFTVFADPHHPPYVLQVLARKIAQVYPIVAYTHMHSSIKELPEKLEHFLDIPSTTNGPMKVRIRLIWKRVGLEPQVVVHPQRLTLKGESVLVRFLVRLCESSCLGGSRKFPELLKYECKGPESAAQVDYWLDIAEQSRIRSGWWKTAAKEAEKSIGRWGWLTEGKQPSLADISLWAVFKQKRVIDSLPISLQQWANKCQALADCRG